MGPNYVNISRAGLFTETPPCGVRACFTYDNGETWNWENEVILRDDGLPGSPAEIARGETDPAFKVYADEAALPEE